MVMFPVWIFMLNWMVFSIFFDVYFDGKTSNLESIQRLDNIRNNYCYNKAKHLIRISYSEINNMEQHLDDYLWHLNEYYNGRIPGPVIRFYGQEYTAS